MTKLTFRSVLGWLILVLGAQAQESFQVNLSEDGETIGDMRPVFLRFSAQAMPAISPREVARRYQRLFDQSDEPEVRLDALNRLTNLHSVAGKDLAFSPEQEERIFRDAIESYEMVVNSGSFQGRLDELLYQSAKAYAYIGQKQRSVERLRQLVGLYPNSSLVPESRFRIAESAFSNGRFGEAEMAYRQVLFSAATAPLKSKARYMLGWSQYKQGNYRQAGESFMAVLDEYAGTSDNFTNLPAAAVDVVDDTFRIVGIMAAETDGATGGTEMLDALLERADERPYDYLLYDRLADHYAARSQFHQSVAVSETFLKKRPYHHSAPASRAQIVGVWNAAQSPERARVAQADYVAAYDEDLRLSALTATDRARWFEYTQTLADYHYYTASKTTEIAEAHTGFTRAAQYYQQLARKHPNPGPVLRLAGDAWLQADEPGAALSAFEMAGYSAPAFDGAADAAWAGIRLRTRLLDSASVESERLATLAQASDRFSGKYPGDVRVPSLQADMANRMLAAQYVEEADRFASEAVGNAHVVMADAYSAWLVLGETRMRAGEFRSAEQAWRQALAIGADIQDLAVASKDQSDLVLQLATSIYRQAEQAGSVGETDQAVAHFQRIETVAPASEIAITGRYDAAITLLKAGHWQRAVNELQRFRADYGGHELAAGIGEKLVLAYESSDQFVRAAQELVRLSQNADPSWNNRLRAAELYHRAGEEALRDALYEKYLAQAMTADSATEHLNQQRMRQRLVESGRDAQQRRVDLIERELASEWHSEDTLTWASTAALTLGEQAVRTFELIQLTLPLTSSLTRKQKTLEEARARYRQAEQLGGDAVRSESLFQRAELYRILARDLIASSRPDGLSELELAQYELLLEEQAYPFEEKAIDLHAANHQQMAAGVYNRWVEQSLEVLGRLFPGRYARDSRWISLQRETNDDA